ncbi:mannose-6-phosphate isomerase, class I [Jeotgalibaca ciconiae]|uniref:Mannose-6-phosphate isomerase n=1 Tax=Jeotgalibaca ciconiae TaxID=2496265 RepID=A0A3Q9BK61_9LACT|nr:mannose-6-phosphate isomerase, class I [Jeotgalibaca ciconiae]AZP04230.1 mannose-6-phosphate isomerase, class I [Jeotgalibaca ciconiae]
MQEPLFVKPKLQEKIWGGTKLRDIYGYDIPSDHTGECWAISAHLDGVGTISSGTYAGMPLNKLYEKEPQLFGNPSSPVFPLLTKIIDATEDLSVQVHPDDVYGLKHENDLGKTECWYVIDADEDSEIVYGHTAKNKEEFSKMISNGQWDDLLRRVKVKAGDFFFVPSGTIHAIGAGIMILETQQSSNTTYRVYDYDRKDNLGNSRELHIQQSIDVTTIPHRDPELSIQTEVQADNEITTLIESDYFSVYRWNIHSEVYFGKKASYTLVSVIEGKGSLIVDNIKYPLNKGDHLILPAPITKWVIEGDIEIIASNPGPKNS